MPGKYDHELKIDTTTDRFVLIRNDDGVALYNVIEEIPEYKRKLTFEQSNWIGGHGQFALKDETCYFEGQSIDTTIDGRVILGPDITEVKDSAGEDLDSAPVCFLWFAAVGKLLCATSGEIYLYDPINNYWTEATTEVSGVVALIEYNGEAYAARGSGNTYYTSLNGDTWTETDLTEDDADGFFVSPNAAGTDNVLWKFNTPNELYSTTDGGAGGDEWSSAAYIGDTSNDITNIFLINDELLIGREDNLFHYDSGGGIHPYMDDLKIARSSQNFKYAAHWQSAVYFTKGTGLGEITASATFDPCGPLTEIDNIGKVGTIVGLTADTGHLYCAVDEGTNTHIYKGRETRTPKGLKWQWCPWVFLSTKACSVIAIVQHSATDRRLWFGYGSNTGYVKVTDNPTTDSNARFCTSGFLRMSYTYGTDPNWDKLWQSVVLETKGCGDGETVQIQYRDDTDATASECVAAHSTNGVHEVNFTSALANKRIQFEIHLASDTNTTSPEVTFFQAKGVEKPTTVRVHDAYYSVGDKPTDRTKTIRDLLRTARTSTTLIKFADLRYGQTTSGTNTGDYYWCVMMPGFPKEVEIKHEKRRQPELAIQVQLQEVSFTIS